MKRVPIGYRIEKWPWGGFMAWRMSLGELFEVPDTRGKTRYESLKKLKAYLDKNPNMRR